jgi:hypothetical protein
MKWFRQSKEFGWCKQPNKINGLKLNFKKSIANSSNYSELALAA